jgi:hypothetical protein
MHYEFHSWTRFALTLQFKLNSSVFSVGHPLTLHDVADWLSTNNSGRAPLQWMVHGATDFVKAAALSLGKLRLGEPHEYLFKTGWSELSEESFLTELQTNVAAVSGSANLSRRLSRSIGGLMKSDTVPRRYFGLRNILKSHWAVGFAAFNQYRLVLVLWPGTIQSSATM